MGQLLRESRVGHADYVPSPSQLVKGEGVRASMLGMLAWLRKLELMGLSSQRIHRVLHRQRWWNCSSALRVWKLAPLQQGACRGDSAAMLDTGPNGECVNGGTICHYHDFRAVVEQAKDGDKLH
eukprot:g32466.t1